MLGFYFGLGIRVFFWGTLAYLTVSLIRAATVMPVLP